MRSAALALLCACANAGSAIYVDVASGSDDNPGTAEAPKQTIGAALTAAVDLHRDLNVGKGTYPEAITLVDGISIYGGFDATHGRSRDAANITTSASPPPLARIPQNIRHAPPLDQPTDRPLH